MINSIIRKQEEKMISRYERLSSALSEISRIIQRISSQVMGEFGLKGSYAKYLLVLRRYPDGITATAICDICERNKADVSRALCELWDMGLVERIGNGSYRAKLTLTPNGRELADRLKLRATGFISYVGKDIAEDEREIFYRSLESIASNLEAIEDGALGPSLT